MVIKNLKIILSVLFFFFIFVSDVFALAIPIESWVTDANTFSSTTIPCSFPPTLTSYSFSTGDSPVFRRNTNFSINIESHRLDGGSSTTVPTYWNSDVWSSKINGTSLFCTKRGNAIFDDLTFFINGLATNITSTFSTKVCDVYTTPSVSTTSSITIDIKNNNLTTCNSGKTTIKIYVKPTLSYNSNDATSGTVPPFQFVDNFVTTGSAVVAGNTGNLTKTGYTFGGWNTNSAGTGTNYLVGSSVPFNSDVDITLYAKWVPNSVSRDLIYDPNGGTGAPLSESHLAESIFTLSSIVPTKTSYNFGGWNTNNTGTGTNYSSGASYTMPNVNTTLYAKWTQNQIPCSYYYEWGECINGTQSPTLVTSYPVGCIESPPPLTSQSCIVSSPTVSLSVQSGNYPTELIPNFGTTSLQWIISNATEGCTASNDGNDSKWAGNSDEIDGTYYTEVGPISSNTIYTLECRNSIGSTIKNLLILITNEGTQSYSLNCEAQFNGGDLGKVFVGKQMNWHVSGIQMDGNSEVTYKLDPPMSQPVIRDLSIKNNILDIFNNYTYVGTKNFEISIEQLDRERNIRHIGSCNTSTLAVPYDGTVIER